MFFVLSDSSLVGIYVGVVREDCEIDLHIFHGHLHIVVKNTAQFSRFTKILINWATALKLVNRSTDIFPTDITLKR